MKFLVLAVFFFSLNGAFGQTDKAKCNSGGGIWQELASSTAYCDGNELAHATFFWGCYCGKHRCWNGDRCVRASGSTRVRSQKEKCMYGGGLLGVSRPCREPSPFGLGVSLCDCGRGRCWNGSKCVNK